MEYLIYRSKALAAPGSGDCQEIVGVSQAKNARLGLTGFLHAEDGQFLQYLEGPSRALWTLYERLHFDGRHTNLVLLGRGSLDKRKFEDWGMGFSDRHVLSFADFTEQVSYLEPEQKSPSTQALYFLMVACARIDIGIVEPPCALSDC